MDYELTPVAADEIPAPRRAGKYDALLQAFVDSGAPASKVSVSGVKPGSLLASLRKATTTLGLSVKAIHREGQVYLLRKDGV